MKIIFFNLNKTFKNNQRIVISKDISIACKTERACVSTQSTAT